MKSWLTAILLLFVLCIKAQDYIVLKTGEEIASKIKEVGDTEIKYNKFENIDGPVYTIKTEKVFMLKYANGTKDIFNAQQEKTNQVPSVVKSQSKATTSIDQSYKLDKEWKKHYATGVALTTVGAVSMAASLPMIALGAIDLDVAYQYVGTRYYDHYIDEGISLTVLGPLLLGSSIAMVAVGAKNLKKAKAIKQGSPKTSNNVEFSPTGVSYTLKF